MMSSLVSKGFSASQVCWNCKNGKRKCSKDLPSCARCSKLLLRCEYEYSTQLSDPNSSLPKLSPPLSPVADGSLTSSLRGASTLFQTLSLSLHTSFGEPDISTQVLSILISNGDGVPSVTHTYFRTIDVWLPIISPKECKDRLATLSTSQDSELACLLLCMYLVVQSPSNSNISSDMRSAIYFQAKALHLAFVAAGNQKLDIIQAGILVSLYEQGHGMIDAAQLTLSICIRSATKMKAALRSATNLQNTEFGRVWWGILILDRHMNQMLPAEEIHLLFGSSNDGIPAMELPTDDDAHILLPRPIFARTTSGVPITNLATTRLGPFCRAAEASHLLGEVLALFARSSVSSEMEQQRSQKLDCRLQKLAMVLLEQAVNGWEECCGAIGLCLSSLLLLHGRTLELAEKNSTSQDAKATARMALISSTRMVIEISRRFQMDLAFIDLPALPLPATFCVFKATLIFIDFATDEFLGADWISNLESLKSTLGHFSKRWNVGKQYLDMVDTALTKKQLSMGDEFDHQLKDPNCMDVEHIY